MPIVRLAALATTFSLAASLAWAQAPAAAATPAASPSASADQGASAGRAVDTNPADPGGNATAAVHRGGAGRFGASRAGAHIAPVHAHAHFHASGGHRGR